MLRDIAADRHHGAHPGPPRSFTQDIGNDPASDLAKLSELSQALNTLLAFVCLNLYLQRSCRLNPQSQATLFLGISMALLIEV